MGRNHWSVTLERGAGSTSSISNHCSKTPRVPFRERVEHLTLFASCPHAMTSVLRGRAEKSENLDSRCSSSCRSGGGAPRCRCQPYSRSVRSQRCRKGPEGFPDQRERGHARGGAGVRQTWGGRGRNALAAVLSEAHAVSPPAWCEVSVERRAAASFPSAPERPSARSPDCSLRAASDAPRTRRARRSSGRSASPC